jgi:hypothetical protein
MRHRRLFGFLVLLGLIRLSLVGTPCGAEPLATPHHVATAQMHETHSADACAGTSTPCAAGHQTPCTDMASCAAAMPTVTATLMAHPGHTVAPIGAAVLLADRGSAPDTPPPRA